MWAVCLPSLVYKQSSSPVGGCCRLFVWTFWPKREREEEEMEILETRGPKGARVNALVPKVAMVFLLLCTLDCVLEMKIWTDSMFLRKRESWWQRLLTA